MESSFSRFDAHFARIDVHFIRIDAHFIRVDAQFAELRVEMQKGFAEMTKWIVGTVIGVGAVTITIMTFVLNNAVLRAPAAAAALPAPIVVDAQLAPPAPVVTQPKP